MQSKDSEGKTTYDAKMTAPAIGVDLGTTYSCVAVFRNGAVEVIENELGNRTTPSVVAFTDKRRLVGDAAKDQDYQNPENTIYDAKRLIGRKFSDSSVQADMKSWPFRVVDDSGRPKVRVTQDGVARTFHPEEISAMVLGALRSAAEARLGAEVTRCVVTVPAHFGDAQRQATRDAANIAGLTVLRVINEPTAGALAYGLGSQDQEHDQGEQNVLIYDFGGGTFDVSILNIEEGVFEVRATRGDTHLGGEDLDDRLLACLADEFARKNPACDIRADCKAMRRLRTACEKAKRQLSAATECGVQLDNLHQGQDFATTLTRSRFEELNEDLFRLTVDLVNKALADAELDKADIDQVVMIGGSTRIPMVQKLLREFFDTKELNTSLSPDEAVARGAAVQAAIISGDPSDTIQDLVLLDVTPLSLGVDIIEGITTRIIERNTVIPTKNTVTFYTARDNQNNVIVSVLEGERTMSKDNVELGCFNVYGIPAGRAETQSVDITFEIDADSILHVTGVVKSTNSQTKATIISNRGRLPPEQIEKLVQDAELFKEVDRQQKEIACMKISLEDFCLNMMSRAEKSTSISDVVKRTIENKCNETLQWLGINQNETKQCYERKLQEIEWICLPLK